METWKKKKKRNAVYEALLQAWGLMKNTGFHTLSDSEWEALIGKAEEILKSDTEMDGLFFRDMFLAVTNYYKRQQEIN